jgi:hypothetical protein
MQKHYLENKQGKLYTGCEMKAGPCDKVSIAHVEGFIEASGLLFVYF